MTPGVMLDGCRFGSIMDEASAPNGSCHAFTAIWGEVQTREGALLRSLASRGSWPLPSCCTKRFKAAIRIQKSSAPCPETLAAGSSNNWRTSKAAGEKACIRCLIAASITWAGLLQLGHTGAAVAHE